MHKHATALFDLPIQLDLPVGYFRTEQFCQDDPPFRAGELLYLNSGPVSDQSISQFQIGTETKILCKNRVILKYFDLRKGICSFLKFVNHIYSNSYFSSPEVCLLVLSSPIPPQPLFVCIWGVVTEKKRVHVRKK